MDTKTPQGSCPDQEQWVYDSSIDSKGKLPHRSTTGAWKAALFIIAIEFSERLSYFGISLNLVVYLTTNLHQDLKTAVRNVNCWSGVTTLMPLLGGFVADAYLGRYATVLVSTLLYLLGLTVLTLSFFIPGLKSCDHSDICTEPRKSHEIAFFIAIYLVSVATGGHKPSLESFGADQFDDNHPEERLQKNSFFNWWNFGLCSGLLTAVTLMVYVEDRVGWGVAAIILLSVMTISLFIFITGRVFYRYRVPSGSPLTPMLHVIVAAFAKRNLLSSSPLYEVSKDEDSHGRLLCHTDRLKFLDKAAVMEDPREKQSPWRLATVTKVESLKLIINMIPIWLSTLAFGLCVSQTTTFFIKQAIVMDRRIFPRSSFSVPPASIFSLSALTMTFFVVLYDKLLVPLLRRVSGNDRGITVLQRIGFGMCFSFVSMVIAAGIEKKRLGIAVTGGPRLNAIWLAPQFITMGIADALTLVGLQEYFYDQVHDSMRSLGIAFYLSVLGASSFVNNVLIAAIDQITGEISGRSWFGKDLNSSRLDRFYWLLAGITAANICVYVVLAKRYSYKKVQQSMAVSDSYPRLGHDDVEAV